MKRVVIILALLFLVGCTTGVETMESGTYAVVDTNKGTFTIKLYEDTPITTNNFVKLAESKFYDDLTFHRYEPGFVIQGGDPKGDGTGGSDDTINLEMVGKSHKKWTIGMARSQEPNSASSQWFVNLADNTFLDSGYAVFGEIVEGTEVAAELRVGDVMKSVKIEKI